MTWRKPLYLLLFAAVVAAMTLAVSRIHWGKITHQDGLIIVDSPEVYTRERLVNDRFMQGNWLLEQLKLEPDLGIPQAISDQSRSTQISVHAGNQNARSDTSTQDGSDSGRESAPSSPQAGTAGVALPPISRFRQRQAYRTEIRSALLETLLDDRHDLDGNTLYMLKFDVTVVPGTDPAALAFITIDLHDEHPDVDQLRETYDRWIEDVRKQVTHNYSGTYNKFLSVGLDIEELDGVIRDLKLSEWITAAAEDADASVPPIDPDSEGKPQDCSAYEDSVFPVSKTDRCIRRNLKDLERFRKTYSKLITFRQMFDSLTGICVQEPPWPPPYLDDLAPTPDCSQQSTPVGLPGGQPGRSGGQSAKPTDQPPGPCDDYRRKYDEWQSQVAQASRSIPFNERGYFIRRPNGDAPPETLDSIDLTQKIRRFMLLDTARRIGDPGISPRNCGIGGPGFLDDAYRRWTAYAKLLSKELDAWDQKANTFLDSWAKLTVQRIDTKTNICQDLKDPRFPRQQFQGFVKKDTDRLLELARKTWAAERLLLQYYIGCQNQQELSSEQNLGDFADFRLTCDPIRELCRIAVNEGRCRPSKKCEEPTSCGERKREEPTRSGGRCAVPDNFKNELNKNRIFTYASTPKTKTDTALHSRQTDRGFDIGAAVKAGLDIDAAVTLIKAQRERDTAATPVTRIVGFSFIKEKDDGEKQDDSKSKDGNPLEEQTRFGWLISPHTSAGVGQPTQQPLTAIVSLPSWRHQVALDISHCWRTPQQLDAAQPGTPGTKSGWPCPRTHPDTDPVRIHLPWTVKEIRRKLGYEIRRVPYIEAINGSTEGTHRAQLYVGQRKARLLIEGGDLWRSTVVTLGAQPANYITVLPNMRGIVATFESIELPPEYDAKQGRCSAQVPIRVWTSESVTEEDEGAATIWIDEASFRNGRCTPDNASTPNQTGGKEKSGTDAAGKANGDGDRNVEFRLVIPADTNSP